MNFVADSEQESRGPDQIIQDAADEFEEVLDYISLDELRGLRTLTGFEHRVLVLKVDILEMRTPASTVMEAAHFSDLDETHSKVWMDEVIEFARCIEEASDEDLVATKLELAVQHRAVVGNMNILDIRIKSREEDTQQNIGNIAVIVEESSK